MKKKVTFILVVRNGEDSVKKCLESIPRQGVDFEELEVLIIDGNSIDNTVLIAKNYLESLGVYYKIIDNPQRTLATGWNLAIDNSSSDFFVRPDSHSELGDNYIKNGITKLENNTEFSVVGGILETKSSTFIGKMISIVLSNPLGVGPSLFRIGLKEDLETDTAVYGIYKREVFEKTGGFNEKLKRNQDIEFHKRAHDKGFRFLTSPDLKAIYYSRPTIKKFCKQAYNNGFWVGKGHGHLRHYVPFFFILGILSIIFFQFKYLYMYLMCYAFCLSLSYVLVSRVYNPIKIIICLFLTFLLHINYGFGTLVGKMNFR